MRAFSRTAALTALAAGLLSLSAAPALAHPQGRSGLETPEQRAAARAAAGEVGPGYLTSGNVELVANIPGHVEAVGMRRVGDVLYVTDDKGLTTYDVTVPEAPARLGFVAVPQQAYTAQEDVDTNGRIALISGLGSLKVIDVSNPASMAVVATLAGAQSHTVSCVLDCSYAYNSDGRIIDLRVPTAPVVLPDTWSKGVTLAQGAHDVTEVSPGVVVTASRPMLTLDARTNPAAPTVTRSTAIPDDRYQHQTLWPRSGTDRFLLVGSEGSGSCSGDITDGGFSVWDTTPATGYALVDDFALGLGTPNEGLAPATTFCSHWFAPRADFHDGGVVAAAWYEHGTRFLDVAPGTGKVTELGWIIPAGTSASMAYWLSPTVLAVGDYQRGLDIIRFDAAGPAPVVPEVPLALLLPLAAALMGAGTVAARRRRTA